MGTVIIQNMSTLTNDAAAIRAGFYMNGRVDEAEKYGIVVKDTTTEKDEFDNVTRLVVYDE